LRYSSDEIKAIVLHYGSYEKAAKKLRIGKASIVDAANADIKGKAYRLSEKNYDKIYRHIKRLSPANKKDIKSWEKILEATQGHIAVKRAFMNAKHSERLWAQKQFTKYSRRMKAQILWHKIMEKFYDKYQWKRGRWR